MHAIPRFAFAALTLFLIFFYNAAVSHAQNDTNLPIEGGGGDCCFEPPPAPSPSPSSSPISPLQSVSGNRVLVVYNRNIPESLDVANYYASRRGIPNNNLLDIGFSSDSEISWGEYHDANGVRDKIINKLNILNTLNILYIVFSYRTPYRVTGASITITNVVPGDLGQGTSIDQYVAKIFDNSSSGSNAYYAPSQSKANQYQPFVSLAAFRNQNSTPLYSVWRLDGPSVSIAKGLIDKAISAETNGLSGYGYFDKDLGGMYQFADDTGGTQKADWDIYRAAEFAREAGFLVIEDNHQQVFGTAPASLRADNVALYAGLYNPGQYNDSFTWNTGAIGFDFNSDAAQGFRSGTRWAGGALLKGITVTGGAIDEPYADYIFKFDGIFRNLFEGANLGDAVLRNTPVLKWRLVNIGDPLYQPFPTRSFPPPASPIPSPWISADINSAAGFAGNYNGNFEVRSFGRTLSGSSDSFNFVYQSVNGDSLVVARVGRTEAITDQSTAGLMFREDTGVGSRYISITINGNGQLQTRVRASPGEFVSGSSIQNIGGEYENPYPLWLKIERTGNMFYGYKSLDGMNWTPIITQSINMSAPALAGMVTLNGNNAVANKAFYDNTMAGPASSPDIDGCMAPCRYDPNTGQYQCPNCCLTRK